MSEVNVAATGNNREETMPVQAVLVLAAGEASRLGQPKQLLPFRNRTLLEQVVAQAAALDHTLTAVVVGAHFEKVSAVLDPAVVKIIENHEWKEGMASSVRNGMRALLAACPSLRNCILAVCDQPYLSSGLFRALQDRHREGKKGITAASYGGITGTPVLFDRKYFNRLMTLEGDAGAKSLLKENPHDVGAVDFPEGVTDIDTWQDYEALAKQTTQP